MKNKEEIKKELHQLIDSIQDEHTLHVLNEDIVPYIIENRKDNQTEKEDSLSDDQLKKLDEALQQADEGNVIDLEEFKRQMEAWHLK